MTCRDDVGAGLVGMHVALEDEEAVKVSAQESTGGSLSMGSGRGGEGVEGAVDGKVLGELCSLALLAPCPSSLRV